MHVPGWQRSTWTDRMLRFGFSVLLGAIIMYFLDPDRGNTRRKLFANEFMGMARRQGRNIGRLRRKMQSDAYGKVQALLHVRAAQDILDDATLTNKVESILFRDPSIPKGDININSEYGVVWLRGTCGSESMIETIEERVRAVEGVRDVQSLLHLSGTPAPQ
jgi:osmotically-inducible protein OsmY